MDDQEIIHGFLRREPQTARTIGNWITRAAWPFRRRLASHWDDVVQEASLEVTRRVTDHACLRQLRSQTRQKQQIAM